MTMNTPTDLDLDYVKNGRGHKPQIINIKILLDVINGSKCKVLHSTQI